MYLLCIDFHYIAICSLGVFGNNNQYELKLKCALCLATW